eukprot:3927820-Prymnesium_polylepis.1
MAKCDECGPGAGHQTKHCLVVAYDKPIPVGISDGRRPRIEAARKAYKIKKGESVNVCFDSDVTRSSRSSIGWGYGKS